MRRYATLAITMAIVFTLTPIRAEAEIVVIKEERPSRHYLRITPADSKMYAKQQLEILNLDKSQYECLLQLWERESNWNHLADNPTSSAFGIAQKLKEKSTNPKTQIDNGLEYIMKRYTSPCKAWEFWQVKRWY